MSTAEKSLTKK